MNGDEVDEEENGLHKDAAAAHSFITLEGGGRV